MSLYHFILPPTIYKGSSFTILPMFGSFSNFIFRQHCVYRVATHCSFKLKLPEYEWCWRLFTCLLVRSMSSFEKYLFKYFAHFYWLFVILSLIYKRSTYILGNILSTDRCFENGLSIYGLPIHFELCCFNDQSF